MILQVNDPSAPELAIYASGSEVGLKHFYEPEPGLFIVETENVIRRALDAGYEPVSMLVDERSSAADLFRQVGDIPIYKAPLDVISQISGFRQARGLLCAMRRRALPDAETILAKAHRIAVLENVENPTNVGAIFRSAAGMGFDGVLLSFRCTDPLYRRASRVSMGTVFQIPWTFVGTKRGGWPEEGMSLLKRYGFETVAMALSERAVSLDDPRLKGHEKLAVLLGNEQEGLLQETLDLCDHLAVIPMENQVDSLNVAAASAVAFWELRKKL